MSKWNAITEAHLTDSGFYELPGSPVEDYYEVRDSCIADGWSWTDDAKPLKGWGDWEATLVAVDPYGEEHYFLVSSSSESVS